MADSISPSDRAAIEGIVAALEAAWKAGDGTTVKSIRLLRPDIALAHVRTQLENPRGPLAGTHRGLFTMVLTREPGGWQIATFHNTPAPAP